MVTRGPKLDPRVGQELVAHGLTKTAIAHTVSTLRKAGMLREEFEEVIESSLKRQFTTASRIHATTVTPYGPLVQAIHLGAEGLPSWEYLNPFAFLYHLSAVSAGFANVMRSVCVDGRPLRIILFADGMVPGNPFRPEKARKLMCIYWCIADWPQWLLQRSFAWPVFAIIRESVLAEIPGGLSRIMRIILRIFFAEVGHSFTRGVLINSPEGDFFVRGIFAGVLADLAGHREVTLAKGHGGVAFCTDCENVVNIRKPKVGQVSLACHDPTKFKRRTDDDIFGIIDALSLAKETSSKAAFAEMQVVCGFNHAPHGLLSDMGLRSIYRPAHHVIRDWMHTLAQDGVCNTHIACAMHAIHDVCGISPERVTTFAGLCSYPSKWGKLDKYAFSMNRLRSTTIVSFASTILTMVQVFHMFLEDFVGDAMPEVVAAFTLLHHIVGILRMGPEDAVRHADTLTNLMSRHLEAIVKLYSDAILKPKAHHLFHVVDGMLFVGKLLSCFVTERKHREVKRSALHIFRHMEHTVLFDLVNKCFQQVIEGHDLYTPTFLVNACSQATTDGAYQSSRRAVLRIGETAVGDLIITDAGVVGKIIAFFQKSGDDTIVAEMDAYECSGGDTRFRCQNRPHRMFFDCRAIVDSLVWYQYSPSIIRVSIPPSLLFGGA